MNIKKTLIKGFSIATAIGAACVLMSSSASAAELPLAAWGNESIFGPTALEEQFMENDSESLSSEGNCVVDEILDMHDSSMDENSVDEDDEICEPTSGELLIEYAETLIGIQYVWGGYTESGLDCSGFVCYAINHCDNNWYIERSQANTLRDYCDVIEEDDLQIGDLIFFQGTYKTNGASHIAIYIGDGMMIHCASGGVAIISLEESAYWQSHLLEYGRLDESLITIEVVEDVDEFID